jgi:dihydrofolate reductase
MIVSLIVAYAKNRVIGFKGQIPWHLSEDLKRFKKLTTGFTIVMGRKTYESIGRPLPKRRNVVLTRDKNFKAEGIDVCASLEEALAEAKSRNEEKVFIIGGGEIYRQSLALADELLITHVDKEVEGDAFFPEWDESLFEESKREDHENYSFVDYQRR